MINSILLISLLIATTAFAAKCPNIEVFPNLNVNNVSNLIK
jgi:hypothetical protein